MSWSTNNTIRQKWKKKDLPPCCCCRWAVELELDTGWLPNREFDSRARQLASTPSGVSFLNLEEEKGIELSKPLELLRTKNMEHVIRGKENKIIRLCIRSLRFSNLQRRRRRRGKRKNQRKNGSRWAVGNRKRGRRKRTTLPLLLSSAPSPGRKGLLVPG